MGVKGVIMTALCCECGAARTFNTRGRHPTDRYANGSAVAPRRLAELQAKGLYVGMQPHWRCLVDLKCDQCGELVRHAVVDESKGFDLCETSNRTVDHARRKAFRRLERLEAAGVKVNWKPAIDFRDDDPRVWFYARDRTAPSGYSLAIREDAQDDPKRLLDAVTEFEDLLDEDDG